MLYFVVWIPLDLKWKFICREYFKSQSQSQVFADFCVVLWDVILKQNEPTEKVLLIMKKANGRKIVKITLATCIFLIKQIFSVLFQLLEMTFQA